MKYLICSLALLFLAGCTSLADKEQSREFKHQRNLELIAAAPATLTVKCSTACTGLEVTYNDPNARPVIERETNGWDVVNTGINQGFGYLRSATPFWALERVVNYGFSAAGDRHVNSFNQDSTHTPSVLTNTSNTTTTTTEREVIYRYEDSTGE